MNITSGIVKYTLIKKTYIIYNIDIKQRNTIKFKNENVYINYLIDLFNR